LHAPLSQKTTQILLDDQDQLTTHQESTEKTGKSDFKSKIRCFQIEITAFLQKKHLFSLFLSFLQKALAEKEGH
jgi:hypothetical protein